MDACSFWQFAACVEGHNRANAPPEEAPAPTNDEFDQMLARFDRQKQKSESLH